MCSTLSADAIAFYPTVTLFKDGDVAGRKLFQYSLETEQLFQVLSVDFENHRL